MATFSSTIKGLSTEVDNADAGTINSQSSVAIAGSNDDKLKFICDNKQIIFKAIDLAKVFTGAKGDKILDTLKAVIESLCA
jgi:hypothetical protein